MTKDSFYDRILSKDDDEDGMAVFLVFREPGQVKAGNGFADVSHFRVGDTKGVSGRLSRIFPQALR